MAGAFHPKLHDDPVIARLLGSDTGMTAGHDWPPHEALTTYWTETGKALFAFCRDGILLDPVGEARFLPFTEIADAGYYNRDMIMRAKTARIEGAMGATLSIALSDGEIVELPLGVNDRGIPHLLSIAKLIEQRVRIARSELRRGV